MRYVALLRGVNVGGKSLLRMAELRACVEELGHDAVRTYIASGNVLFESPQRSAALLEAELERALEARFALRTKVVLRSRTDLGRLVAALPPRWIRDAGLRVNVAFLGRGVNAKTLARGLTPKDGVDELLALPGALAWATRRDALTRSGLRGLISQPVYKELTVRNLNTTCKLAELLDA